MASLNKVTSFIFILFCLTFFWDTIGLSTFIHCFHNDFYLQILGWFPSYLSEMVYLHKSLFFCFCTYILNFSVLGAILLPCMLIFCLL